MSVYVWRRDAFDDVLKEVALALVCAEGIHLTVGKLSSNGVGHDLATTVDCIV